MIRGRPCGIGATETRQTAEKSPLPRLDFRIVHRRFGPPEVGMHRLGVVFPLANRWKVFDGRHAPPPGSHISRRARGKGLGRVVLIAAGPRTRREGGTGRSEMRQPVLDDDIARSAPDFAGLGSLVSRRLRLDRLRQSPHKVIRRRMGNARRWWRSQRRRLLAGSLAS